MWQRPQEPIEPPFQTLCGGWWKNATRSGNENEKRQPRWKEDNGRDRYLRQGPVLPSNPADRRLRLRSIPADRPVTTRPGTKSTTTNLFGKADGPGGD